jgi:hypothetical protein
MVLAHAIWAWGGIQVAAAIALAVVPIRDRLQMSPRSAFLYALLFMTSLPLLHNFKWGQVSVLVTLSVLASVRLAEDRRDVPAGLVLALGAAIKYYAAFFLIYYLIRRRWRVVTSFAGAALVTLFVVPASVMGPMGVIRFQRESWLELSRASALIAQDWNSQFFAHVVLRWLGIADAPDAVRALTFGGWAAVAAMVWLVWLLRERGDTAASDLSLAALFLSLPFVVSTSWPHYLVYLPFCQALVVKSLWSRPAAPRSRILLGASLLSVALASVFALNVSPHWNSYARSGVLLVANVLLMPALAAAVRATSGPAASGGPPAGAEGSA